MNTPKDKLSYTYCAVHGVLPKQDIQVTSYSKLEGLVNTQKGL